MPDFLFQSVEILSANVNICFVTMGQHMRYAVLNELFFISFCPPSPAFMFLADIVLLFSQMETEDETRGY